MEKITKGHALSMSEDVLKTNIEKLKKLFPSVFKEGKIDVTELEALFGKEIEVGDEFYRFNWAGKNESRREANKPSSATLRPDIESSRHWETTKNVFIEGDNLEVLKLLQKSYAGQIKMIYIDPPYNTGKDFVYEDNYSDSLRNYLRITGQIDSDGRKISTNSESDGRFHSKWLSMMYPRLKLARNLLHANGVIFVSIDDHELHNLKKLCDEIFGEENCVGQWNWYKSATPPNLSRKIKKNLEYILCYQKQKNDVVFSGIKKSSTSDDPITKPQNTFKTLTFPPNTMNVNLSDGIIKVGTYGTEKYPNELLNELIVEDGKNKNEVSFKNRFVWTQPKLAEEIKNGTTINLSKNLVISYKKAEYGEEVPPNIIDENVNVTTTENAGKALNELFGGLKVFDYPKPISLIQYLIGFLCESGDLVLDFFAGSGSTGEAIYNLQASEANNLKLSFILVQLDAPLDEAEATTEAEKQVIRNAIKVLKDIKKPLKISEITKERLRRASEAIVSGLKLRQKTNKIKKSTELALETESDIVPIEQLIESFDGGFKAFKLDSSNINAWDGSLANFDKNLFNASTNIKSDRTDDDVLYEVLLKYGLNLTVAIEEKKIDKQKVYSVGLGALFVCVSETITTDVAEGIGKWKEELSPTSCRVLFRDNGFKDDVAKTNSVQILKRYGINEINSL